MEWSLFRLRSAVTLKSGRSKVQLPQTYEYGAVILDSAERDSSYLKRITFGQRSAQINYFGTLSLT